MSPPPPLHRPNTFGEAPPVVQILPCSVQCRVMQWRRGGEIIPGQVMIVFASSLQHAAGIVGSRDAPSHFSRSVSRVRLPFPNLDSSKITCRASYSEGLLFRASERVHAHAAGSILTACRPGNWLTSPPPALGECPASGNSLPLRYYSLEAARQPRRGGKRN